MKKIDTIDRWFYLFLIVHLVVWTLLPTILRHTLPLDAMEGTTWGRQLCLGYDKNPFLNAWLTELAVWIGGKNGWVVYGFGQLCVVATFWSVWRLGKKLLNPLYALVGVMILEGMTNYNIDAIDFDDNVLLLMFWALVIYFFYLAIKNQKIRHWVLVGLFAGLAMMAKYFIVILFAPMFLFLLINSQARKSFSSKGLYIAGIVFVLSILPHVIWLFSHDFITVRYAFYRTNTVHALREHFTFFWRFGSSYLSAFLVSLLLFLPVWIGGRKQQSLLLSSPCSLSSFDWQYLLWMGMGPFVLVLLLSLVFGIALHLGWGQPLASLWGLILVAIIQPSITVKGFRRFLIFFAFVFVLGASAYVFSNLYSSEAGANYPGPVMAKKITAEWHDRYHTKLQYIIGPRFTAGVVSFYSNDRPSVYMDADPNASFWISERDLRKKGAMIIWDADDGPIPSDWVKRFHLMKDKHIEAFSWMRNATRDNPVKIGVAFLPPAPVQ